MSKTKIEGYAPYIIEGARDHLGYKIDDDSHDDEVLKYLQGGEKISKSKHIKQ